MLVTIVNGNCELILRRNDGIMNFTPFYQFEIFWVVGLIVVRVNLTLQSIPVVIGIKSLPFVQDCALSKYIWVASPFTICQISKGDFAICANQCFMVRKSTF